MHHWIKKVHVQALMWADTKWAGGIMFAWTFADASFLPLPTPMFFMAVVLLNIPKAIKFVVWGTLGSLIGAIAGYAIGHFAWIKTNGDFTALATFVFNNVPGFSENSYLTIQKYYIAWDFWILFIASFMPVPFKIFSISSGVFNINFLMFCIATLLSQGIKFYLFALLAIKIGPGIKKLIKSKLKTIIIIASIILIIAIALYSIIA